MDRRLQPKKRQVRRRLYGRTKPGTLLKHHIPIRTDHSDVTTPGFLRFRDQDRTRVFRLERVLVQHAYYDGLTKDVFVQRLFQVLRGAVHS